jgi:starch synthase
LVIICSSSHRHLLLDIDLEVNMKIVMIAAECVPYVKTGGLADVVGSLPGVLRKMGHEVIVILPLYSMIDYPRHGLQPALSSMGVWMGNELEWCSVHQADMQGTPIYFIETNKYFARYGLYHDASFNDYLDNPQRFGLLTRAGLQFCTDINFKPDIVHAHDWHTALAPAFLKIWHWNDPFLGSAASVLTIHNLAYQGVYDKSSYEYLGLRWENFTPRKFEDHGKINFLKGGIVFADMVNTVSPTYASESRTPAGGYGLAPYLNDKGDNYWGILNGCDYEKWNPTLDTSIPARYSMDDLSGKAVCKQALQERMGLEVNPYVPLIGVVSRLVGQKGLDLLAQVMDRILSQMQVQFAILGSGEKDLETFYGQIPSRYPGRISSFIGYSDELSHWIEAGSDFFIMPSIYEPCGLNQMYSLKYGTLPIVRATGGLDDTVQQYDESSGTGTGFKFWEISGNAIYFTVGWAVSTYYDRPEHMKKMIRQAMQQDYSWEKSAAVYVALYDRAIEVKPK